MTFPKRRKKEFEYAQNRRLRNKMIQRQKGRLKKTICQTPFKTSLHITFISVVTLLFLSHLSHRLFFHSQWQTNQLVVLLIMGIVLSAFSIVWVYHTECCSFYAPFTNLSTLVDLLSKSQMWAYSPRSFHHYSAVDS